MDPISSSTEPHPAPTGPNLNVVVAGLQRQCRDLRALLIGLMAILLLLSMGMNLFFARQWRSLRIQVGEQRSLYQRVATEFRTKNEPQVKSFLGLLHQFASTNKDFQPLLDKYRPLLEVYYPPSLTPVPASSPAVQP